MAPIHALLIVISFLSAAFGTPHRRSYLYVGGQYTLNSDGEHILTGQMYVERLTPVNGPTKPHPIVLIHGADQTATNWLNKPDGGEGWASYFLSHGYECYLLDLTFRGRSPWLPGTGNLTKYSTEHLQRYFTAPERYNLWPQAGKHTQWPGEGVMGDQVFDAYYASTVPSLADGETQQRTMQLAGAALLDVIGRPVVILAHSQGGLMAWGIADARPDLVHAMVSIEPTGPPFNDALFGNGLARRYGLTDTPIAYAPTVADPAVDFAKQTIPSNSSAVAECVLQADDPPPRQLANLARIPTLMVTTEASYHVAYDWCTVWFLRQAGVQVDHLQLGEVGIHGNGHMVFLEQNSDKVAALLRGWMQNIE
ncbi:alpha/beta hydrolase [Aspergillus clavatus NRRL 1]|uniref:AB hydrolase-1 domain-containing protein n=1 Tax=Aspergillus clavatus (strain ATCC 1007 / CBS 513.65 / DSM 816 / NCTC 3887 / NRRL 1 / QM 1276 / 107) TaxID=344612 RepID=A1C8P7_ASPCL|nr:uncharacterized protein ACLA_044040 [Aspergillus clavatus NRRL 1]EAW13684.1 conserved hypothetical protein [Aspergillus clavatus NRRL 1]